MKTSLLSAALSTGLLVWGSATTRAEVFGPGEYDVKAAYLYNFAKFVEWPYPAASHAAFDICLLGDDPFKGNLQQTLVGKTIQDKNIVVRHTRTFDEVKACQVLFLSPDSPRELNSVLPRLAGLPILTVSDAPGFTQSGGMIGFHMVGHTVRFDINLLAAEASKLKLSSQLLKVAKTIIGAPPGAAP